MKRKLKHFNKSFKELNKRRKLRGEKPLTEKEYANLSDKIALSRDGRIHPIKQRGFDHALAFFGKEILEKKKSCIHCGNRKRYIDFIVRYNPPSIQNICRDCEQNRKKQYD